jgi:NNP family nitrate/nitrite transporter-like MFS transporter
MIPVLFAAEPEPRARRLSGALIGLAGAVGAFGGVLVNMAFRQSFLSTKNGDAAYLTFLVFYALCAVLTWAVYLRRAAPAESAESALVDLA